MAELFDACPIKPRAVTLAVPLAAPASAAGAASDLMDALPRGDRLLIQKMASDAAVPVDALVPEIVAAYLRLLRDVPAALPSDPMRSLRVNAAGRAGRGQ